MPTPCGNNPMDEETRGKELPPVLAAGWKMVEGKEAITKTFEFDSFNDAWQWMSGVALTAEHHFHHPDWHQNWKTVTITWRTHEGRNLSIRDMIMARTCDDKYKKFVA